MRKFEDVDVISTLRKIVDNNTLFYQTDFKYDAETLKEAAEGSHFYWMSRTSGTWLINDRDAHIRNTYDYNTWQYYSDTKYYGVKAFAVAVKENINGQPYGDIYELHYNKHREEIRQNSFNARTVDVTFKPTRWQERTTREIDVAEYNDNWRAIVNRYGEAESVRHNLSKEDESRLAEVLRGMRARREEEAVPVSAGSYIKEMVKERFHEYGYTRDDMVFTTPEDADTALKHLIPVHILNPDNTAEQAKKPKEIADALYGGKMFGMNGRDKKLLNFFKAGNTLADLPFSHADLTTIFYMALDKGKESVEDNEQRKALDNVIHVLDTVLFADDGCEADEIALERDLDGGMGDSEENEDIEP
jgi:hypothetical protein